MRSMRFHVLAALIAVGGANLAPGGDPLVVQHGEHVYRMDAATGAVQSGSRGGDAFLDACADHYALFVDVGKVSAESDETHDRVVEHEYRVEERAVRLVCRNDAMGLTIHKTYRVDEGGGALFKKIRVVPDEGVRGLFILESGVSVPGGWWRGAVIWDAVWHTGLDSYYPTTAIKEEIDLAPSNGQRSVLMLYHPRRDATLVHYRWGGSEFEFFESVGEVQPYGKKVRPQSWRMVMHAGVLGREYLPPPTVTTVYAAATGSPLAFLRRYAGQPGYRRLGAELLEYAPAWLNDTVLDMAVDLMGRWGGNGPRGWIEQVAPVINRKYHFGYVQLHLWGVWPTEHYIAKPEQVDDASMCDPVAIAETIAKLKASSSRTKVGPYSHFGSTGWYHGFPLAKRAVEEGWAVRDAEGKVIRSPTDYTGDPAAVHLVRSSKPYQNFMKQRWVEIIENLKTDFMYLDTAVNPGSLRYGMDWPSLTYTDGATVQYFYRDLVELAIDRHNPVFMNYPVPVGNTHGYTEFYFVVDHRRHWRLPSARLAVQQALNAPGRRLYGCGGWLYGTGDPAEPAMVRHLHLAHQYGLGVSLLSLEPRRKGSPASYENFAEFLIKGAPYVQGLFELRNRELVDARVTPDFWALEGDLETMAWRAVEGDYGLLTICNHASGPVSEEVAFDTQPLGVRASHAAFVWRLEMADPRHVGFDGVTVDSPIRRLAAQKLMRLVKSPAERMSVAVDLPPDNPVTLLVSRSPAVITAVDGKACQYWLPAAYGVTVDGALEPVSGETDVVVDCPAAKAALLIAAPHDDPDRLSVTQGRWDKGLPGVGVAIGTEPIDFEVAKLAGHLFVRVSVKKGRTQITVR